MIQRNVRKFLMILSACVLGLGTAGLSWLVAQTTMPAFDPTVVHYGDYIMLSCELSGVAGKPSVYLAADDRMAIPDSSSTTGALINNPNYKKLTIALEQGAHCFWIVLPEVGKNIDTLYGKTIGATDKVRLEHVTTGQRLKYDTAGLATFVNGSLNATTYSFEQDPVETNWQLISSYKVGSSCEIRPDGSHWLAVQAGRAVGADVKEGSSFVFSTDKTANITWKIANSYAASQFHDKTPTDQPIDGTTYVMITHESGQPEILSPVPNTTLGKDVPRLLPIEDSPAFTEKSAVRIERSANSRFFNIRSGTRYATITGNNNVVFSDEKISMNTEWIIVPDGYGHIKLAWRGTTGYLSGSAPKDTDALKSWVDGSLWIQDAQNKIATAADGWSFCVFPLKNIRDCVLTNDTADTMNYDPAYDSPYTPIFHPAWILPAPKPGEKNTLEFVVSIDPGANDLDPRDLYVVFSGLPKMAADSLVIHMNESKFTIANRYLDIANRNDCHVYQSADPADTSLNPRHIESVALGSLDTDGVMVTTRVAADKPADGIKYKIELYGPLLADGKPRSDTHIALSKSQSSDAPGAVAARFEDDHIKLPSNGIGYFGFGGSSSTITIKDIRLNGELVSSLNTPFTPDSLINLSSSYKANPGDVLIDRVTVGSRTVMVGTEQKNVYVAWAIGSSVNDKYKNKLFEWKFDAQNVGSWFYHDAMALTADGTKAPLSGFTDICASSDGRLFAVAQGKLYRYNWSTDGLTNGTWSYYPTKGGAGQDLVVTQVAVGRTREITEEIKNSDGTSAKKTQKNSALFIVVKEGMGERVYQSTDAENSAASWVSRSVQIDKILRMGISSWDLVIAVNNYGQAYMLTKLGLTTNNTWEKLFDTLLIRTKKTDGSFIERREDDLRLLDIAVGGPNLIYGIAVANPPLRPYNLLVRYSSEDKAWVPVEDEAGKDMSGMITVSVNEAGSFMFVDEAGKSYRSEEMAAKFLVVTPSGKTQPVETPKTPPPGGSSSTTTAEEKPIIDDGKSSDTATDKGEKPAGPQGPRPGRPINPRGRKSVGMPASPRTKPGSSQGSSKGKQSSLRGGAAGNRSNQKSSNRPVTKRQDVSLSGAKASARAGSARGGGKARVAAGKPRSGGSSPRGNNRGAQGRK